MEYTKEKEEDREDARECLIYVSSESQKEKGEEMAEDFLELIKDTSLQIQIPQWIP